MDTISSYSLPILAQSINNSTLTFHPFTTQTLKYFRRPSKGSQFHAHNGNLPSPLETIFNSIDNFICTSLEPPTDHDPILSGIFAPVPELSPTTCDVVEGSLPSCLDGASIRNGPNPQFTPRGPFHLFDGDGMLHSIKISRGRTTFCSRYVKTYKFLVEREIGYSVFPSFFSSCNGFASTVARFLLFYARILVGQIDAFKGRGVASTSLAVIAGKIFALDESDLPYEIRVTSEGDLITLGRHEFPSNGLEKFTAMTAHPRVDPVTGETFAFRYGVVRPFLKYFRIDPDGRKQADVPIFSLERPAVIHDFVVTENYAIFPETQMCVKVSEIMKGRSPVVVDSGKIPRIGIIPKYAEDEKGMWWMDAPGVNLTHIANAWEEDGGNIVVVVGSNLSSIKHAWENLDFRHYTMDKIVINVKNRTLERQPLSPEVLELGCVNTSYAGKKSRYLYSLIVKIPEMVVGVVKLDMSKNCDNNKVASRLYAPGCVGGEAIFVSRDSSNPWLDEDDGYVVTYVHDENSNESSFLVLDAKSAKLDIVARVKLPHRVPCGFHGIFVPQSVLENNS